MTKYEIPNKSHGPIMKFTLEQCEEVGQDGERDNGKEKHVSCGNLVNFPTRME